MNRGRLPILLLAVVLATLLLPPGASARGLPTADAPQWTGLSGIWDLFTRFFLPAQSKNRASIDPNGGTGTATDPTEDSDNRAGIDPDGSNGATSDPTENSDNRAGIDPNG